MLRTAGIPESDKQNDLEDKVLRTLKKLGCNIASNILEAFNCVGRYIWSFHQMLETEGLPINIFGKKIPEQTGYEGYIS